MSCKGIVLLLPTMIPNLIVILGPTASGKTKLATGIAAALRSEIISADSRQVYQHMDIGTGKDLNEYNVNGYQVPHHLIDMIPAGERYHIHQFKSDFFTAFEHIQQLGKLPILCGGSGLYIDAILSNLDYTGIPVNENIRAQLQGLSKPELEKLFDQLPPHPYKQRVDRSTAKRLLRGIEIISYVNEQAYTPTPRPEIKPIIFGTYLPLEQRRKNIEKRLVFRLENGLVDEVQTLLQTLSKEQLFYYGLEYKFVTRFLVGELSYESMQQQLLIAIQQYAKRQMTYFRKMERDGKHIHWIDTSDGISSREIEPILNRL
jgi:tRNA dimethylallyltransferase